VLHLRHLLRNHGRFDFWWSHRFLFVFGRLDVVFDELGIGISFDLFSLSFCFRFWRFFLGAIVASGSLSCPRVILIKRKALLSLKVYKYELTQTQRSYTTLQISLSLCSRFVPRRFLILIRMGWSHLLRQNFRNRRIQLHPPLLRRH
jgi:hypothetical protein